MICGAVGRYLAHLRHVAARSSASAPAVKALASLSGLILPSGPLFMADTTRQSTNPDAETLAEITLMAAEEVAASASRRRSRCCRIPTSEPVTTKAARRCGASWDFVNELDPTIWKIEGEMHADAAISTFIREDNFPNSRLEGPANLLIMPTLDAAHISFTLLRSVTKSVAIGPMLLGTARPAHILTTSATVRSLLNMSAVAIADSVRDEQTSGQT